MKTKRKPRGGSRRGRPNKATANAREAISRVVDGNVERLQEWLDKIAKTEGPLAAWRCFVDLLEFAVPKLVRSELQIAPAHSGEQRVITDPVEASRVYSEIMSGTLDLASVRFESRIEATAPAIAAPEPASPAIEPPAPPQIAAPAQAASEPAAQDGLSVWQRLGRQQP